MNEENSRKTESITNMVKEQTELEEILKANIYFELLRATLKKGQIGKYQVIMACKDTDLKMHVHPRQTGCRNEQMLTKTDPHG